VASGLLFWGVIDDLINLGRSDNREIKGGIER
jgi:hypothetical protein